MNKHVGFVAIIGRPNVGKSTLMNRILGQKVSITSKRPQTTRHRILGIKTTETSQVIYVDTPGVHQGGKRAMNKYMNRTASQSLADVDAVIFIVEGTYWTEEDDFVAEKLKTLNCPLYIVVNKVDLVKSKEELFPVLEKLQALLSPKEIIPVSAKTGVQVDELESSIEAILPQGDVFFPEDQITDRTDRFLAAEVIREKLMRMLGQELPYYLTVEIEQFKEKKSLISISAVIWVERDGQKAIIIGKNGEKLKEVGTIARTDLEKFFGSKIFLELWVKVKGGWSDDIRALRSLGYTDE